MNHKPLEQARDADLRSSFAALQRAGQRARELAQRTGTALVVSRDGVIAHVYFQRSLGQTGGQSTALRDAPGPAHAPVPATPAVT